MEIIEDLKNIRSIMLEMERLNAELKVLRVKKKIIEDKVSHYLYSQDKPGVKYGDLIIMCKSRKTTKKLKTQEKKSNIINLLEDMGIKDPIQAWEEITRAMKGEEITVDTIQIKQEKQKNQDVLVV